MRKIYAELMHINALHVLTKFGQTAHFTVLVGPSCPRQYCRLGSNQTPRASPSVELCESRGVTELRTYRSRITSPQPLRSARFPSIMERTKWSNLPGV